MLLILWFAGVSGGAGNPGEADDVADDELEDDELEDDELADDEQAAKERGVVLRQLYVGAGLVLAGALIAVFAAKWCDCQKGFALAIGTAVIGVGATMIPPGAAAGAHERASDRREARARRRTRDRRRQPAPRNRDRRTRRRRQGPENRGG